MTQPTPEQITWLKEYHRTFGKHTLADKLGVTLPVLNKWLKMLGPKRQRILSDDQKKFISEHYHKWTHKKIADELKVPVTAVSQYCHREKLIKKGPNKVQQPPKKIIPYKQSEVKPIARVKGEYSAGQETLIDKYLKMDI